MWRVAALSKATRSNGHEAAVVVALCSTGQHDPMCRNGCLWPEACMLGKPRVLRSLPMMWTRRNVVSHWKRRAGGSNLAEVVFPDASLGKGELKLVQKQQLWFEIQRTRRHIRDLLHSIPPAWLRGMTSFRRAQHLIDHCADSHNVTRGQRSSPHMMLRFKHDPARPHLLNHVQALIMLHTRHIIRTTAHHTVSHPTATPKYS